MVNIDKEKCIGCGQCARDCVAENIKLRDAKAECAGPCILCGHCVAVCPQGAVAIPEYDMSDVEAFDESLFSLDIRKFLHIIKQRRSIRRYANKPVEREKLENILQAGRYSATGSNMQGCRFIIIQERLAEFRDLIWDGVSTMEDDGQFPDRAAAMQNFIQMRASGTDFLFRDAPVVIYIAADSVVDAALAAQSMEFAAISQGLGVLYNGFLVYAATMLPSAREFLESGSKPLAVCMLLGYPKLSYRRSAPRRSADVRWK